MANGLKSIADIFERSLYRIPDYQRGYSWKNDKELVDFWEDLENLPDNRAHYTGVLTIEKVQQDIYKTWQEDMWIISEKLFKPFFIVDGQQRLTTIVILIQVILEKLGKNEELNYDSKEVIQSKYIYQSPDKGISRSYIFGYQRDNPSYEYLKTKIFNGQSNTNQDITTLYTHNLENAKIYFRDKIQGMQKGKLELLFKKVTIFLKFNVYEIDDDLDVFVAFETMNNRGLKLSKLELLKNRLIYLSTLLDESEDNKNILRNNINESWKTIYEFLGKNRINPLDDDTFLKNHWIMYFKFGKNKADEYIKFLLEEKFTAKNVLTKTLSIQEIQTYITSLQDGVRQWYILFNPEDSKLDDEVKKWIDKLNRLGYGAFAPLAMATLVKKIEKGELVELLKVMERYNFLIFEISQRRASTGDSAFYKSATELYKEEKDIKDIVVNIKVEWIDKYLDISKFKDHIKDRFLLEDKNGYYGWTGLDYFLFEYELDLQSKSKTSNIKINWKEFSEYKKDFVSIEHIYPQTPDKECWQMYFKEFSDEQKNYLCNTLGNLLPLSQRKNSSLQNNCFADKKRKGDVGYFTGSYCENEIAQSNEWTPNSILSRGIKMLVFLEKRWGVKIENKKDLLFLSWLNESI